jgi:hypothetical protein
MTTVMDRAINCLTAAAARVRAQVVWDLWRTKRHWRSSTSALGSLANNWTDCSPLIIIITALVQQTK